ncbi:MFS general substrate transporter [Hypoxylon crocopeplum]|nr:MFS general substrate transporter [Hypoxylon crocopeplum]
MAAPTTQAVPMSQEQDVEKKFSGDENIKEVGNGLDVESDTSSKHKQDGVKRVEAITTVWSKELLIVMFILLYLATFVDMLLQSVQSNLVPYITSAFNKHGLLATTGIVATIIGGVSKLTIAKIIDIWGRCEGFVFMVALVVIGMILKATCTSVEMYGAAHAIYWVGHLGMQYIIDIILADTTTLKNRMIMYGLNSTPTIATTFAGPKIADLFYTYVNFRWAFGAFSIILVTFCLPIAAIFILSKRKAVKLGVYPTRVKTRTVWESVKHYFIEFDVIGMLLTISGWSLLLLPFSIVTYAPNGWKTGYIIAMIVLGFCSLVAFVFWEKYVAPVAYFPFRFLKDRTIFAACLLYGVMFISIYCWDGYYGSYLQVVHDESITISGYVLNSFSLTSSFIGPFVGLIMRHTGNYKWTAMCGIPFAVLGTALLIHFRTPESYVGYLVMCQIFNGVSSGIWVLAAQLAIQASVTHQEIAVAMAIFGLFGSIGAAIGLAIAGALWNNILPQKLREFLPEGSKDLVSNIFGNINVQKSYPMGSPIRTAIIEALGDVQRKMVIAGSAFLPVCVICLIVWKNINVVKLEQTRGKQTKGNVW